MGRPKLCRSKQCTSEGDKRKAVVDGYCRACYMREWRRRKANEPTSFELPTLADVEAAIDLDELILIPPQEPLEGESAGARSVREYLQRQAALLRRATILKMLRRGMQETEIIYCFYNNEALRRAYIDQATAPVVTLRRDLDAMKGVLD